MARAAAKKKTATKVKKAVARRKADTAPVPLARINRCILLAREQKVMMDADLADLYGVSTKALNQAVKRNLDRFPPDFMFQLTWEETRLLRSQFVTLNSDGGGLEPRSQSVTLKRGVNVKYRPYAFTEQGVAMLSSVPRNKRAVQVDIETLDPACAYCNC